MIRCDIEMLVARVHTRIGVVMGRGKDDEKGFEQSLKLVRSVYFRCLVKHVEDAMLEERLSCTISTNACILQRTSHVLLE